MCSGAWLNQLVDLPSLLDDQEDDDIDVQDELTNGRLLPAPAALTRDQPVPAEPT